MSQASTGKGVIPPSIDALFDPHTRARALRELSDADLLLAAVICNSEPIHPGLDEQRAARELCEYVTNATPQSQDVLLREALRWISPSVLLPVLAELDGYDSSSPPHDHLSHLLDSKWRETCITIVSERLVRCTWLSHNDVTLLVSLIPLVSNTDVLNAASKLRNSDVSTRALHRLAELAALPDTC